MSARKEAELQQAARRLHRLEHAGDFRVQLGGINRAFGGIDRAPHFQEAEHLGDAFAALLAGFQLQDAHRFGDSGCNRLD